MPSKLTAKQKKAIQLIRQGKTPTEAMREAGYAESTLQAPGQNLLGAAKVQGFIDKLRENHLENGLDAKKMSDKLLEWIDAKETYVTKDGDEIVKNDYRTQVKAGEMMRKDFGWEAKENTITQNNYYFDGDVAQEFSKFLHRKLDEQTLS